MESRFYTEVENKEQSSAVQACLLLAGYRWVQGAKTVLHTDAKYLLVDDLNTEKPSISYRNRLPDNMLYSDMHKHVFYPAIKLIQDLSTSG